MKTMGKIMVCLFESVHFYRGHGKTKDSEENG